MDTLLRTLALCFVALAAANACSVSQFPCQLRGGGDCLAQRWVCDGDNDCVDSSDESQCGSPRTCPDGFFSCSSGRCIPESWVCDGANDCRDSGTDEQNCGDDPESTPPSGPQVCTEEQFSCQLRSGDNACINLLQVCDGNNDCIDNRDENHCGSTRTCPENWFACASGRCVPSSFVCDGDNDCNDDGSDEVCVANTAEATTNNEARGNCSEVQYACRSHRNPDGCIPLQFVCDGDNSDCIDRSDESSCGSSRTCPDRWHACASGRCIPENFVCDGGNDCPDGSDESQCGSSPATPTVHCASDEFACRSRRRSSGCIPRRWVCDGDHSDCYDDSDEQNCGSHAVTPGTPTSTTTAHCSSNEFACRSPRRSSGCIPRSWVCDGDRGDCYDESDEQNCGTHHCSKIEFACQSRRNHRGCVPLSWVCDGDHSDCVDDTDEQNCGSPRTCPADYFACQNGRCIPSSWVCDGSNNCHDAEQSDERNCRSGSNTTASTLEPTTPGTDAPAVTDAAVRPTPESGEAVEAARSSPVRLELPSWLATDQDAHFALSLAPMLRARSTRDKLDAQMAVLRLFRDLARN